MAVAKLLEKEALEQTNALKEQTNGAHFPGTQDSMKWLHPRAFCDVRGHMFEGWHVRTAGRRSGPDRKSAVGLDTLTSPMFHLYTGRIVPDQEVPRQRASGLGQGRRRLGFGGPRYRCDRCRAKCTALLTDLLTISIIGSREIPLPMESPSVSGGDHRHAGAQSHPKF